MAPRKDEYITLCGKKGLGDGGVIKLRSLSLGDDSRLSRWAQCYHKGMQAVSRSGKWKELDSFLEPPDGTQLC